MIQNNKFGFLYQYKEQQWTDAGGGVSNVLLLSLSVLVKCVLKMKEYKGTLVSI